MKKIVSAILVAISATAAQAQDSAMFRKISDEVMLHGTCYDNLRVLCKSVGHRISGSPAAAKAVNWGEKAMKDAGADKVWLQAADVPYWYRGKESLQLKMDGAYKEVVALSLGNSEGTCGKTLEAPIVMVHDYDELKALPDAAVKGKIVFFDYRFRQDFVFTFKGYGDAVKYRGGGPSAAAKKGAVGIIIRSMSTGADDYPHTGGTHYTDSIKKVPAMALGNYTADKLEAACKKGTVMAKIKSDCKMMPDMVRSYNVIGEIKGSEVPEKIITVGGHLDSWDVGEGAQDDGAGCVQSMEVIRALKAIGYKPKCTIRAVLFMNEENGQKGGQAYADSAVARGEHHVIAIETDAGGFSPRGIGLEMSAAQKEQVTKYKDLFLPWGVYDFTREEGGADIDPIGKKLKIPMAGLVPDCQRYFDVHHTNNDVFENVNHRELKLGAAVLAQLIYLVDQHGLN
ncbi:MAG: M20/M25/M40 family metallo-hydrolase [Bacteroidetes bacterium]|nr:M20/M25/M40 family metallo-hydrolase [Bacteroidota bacterium]